MKRLLHGVFQYGEVFYYDGEGLNALEERYFDTLSNFQLNSEIYYDSRTRICVATQRQNHSIVRSGQMVCHCPIFNFSVSHLITSGGKSIASPGFVARPYQEEGF